MDSLKCNALWRERKRLAGGIGGVAPDGQPEGCVGHDVARVAGALRAPVGASRHGKHLDVFVSAGFDNPLPAYSTCLDGLFNRHVGYYSAVAGKSFKTIISDVKYTSYQLFDFRCIVKMTHMLSDSDTTLSAIEQPAARFSLRYQVWAQMQARPFVATGLLLALVSVLFLLGYSVLQIASDRQQLEGLRLAFQGGMVAFVATTLGAVPTLFLRRLPQRTEDVMLGLAAGMMLAATAFSLLVPALDAAGNVLTSKAWASGTVVMGMTLGVLLMLGMDALLPHEHAVVGTVGVGHERLSRLWLFVFAIAVHNLPEGMAIGASFAQADLHVGIPLTTAIALQDIPEGLAVALALQSAGFSAKKSVWVAAATGLLEPLGALLGLGLSSGLVLAYPIGLSLAAGAMLFVVSHEVIPETHRNGHQTAATLGLMAGFAIMMVLDTALG